jgi:hypothetical protein
MTEKHVLNQQPRDPFRARDTIAFASPMMVLTPLGLVLGAGTVLLPAEGARKLKSLKGSEQQLLALLSAAYGVGVAPTVLGNIERAAKCWREGDDYTAHIHLAHTGLRALDDIPDAAHRLRMAKGVLDHGGSPRSVFEALRLDPRYIDALENTTILNSLVCLPDIPAAASGQARIGPARQMPPAGFSPTQRRTTLGRLALKMQPTNRRSPASATTRARRSSQRRRFPRSGRSTTLRPFGTSRKPPCDGLPEPAGSHFYASGFGSV